MDDEGAGPRKRRLWCFCGVSAQNRRRSVPFGCLRKPCDEQLEPLHMTPGRAPGLKHREQLEQPVTETTRSKILRSQGQQPSCEQSSCSTLQQIRLSHPDLHKTDM